MTQTPTATSPHDTAYVRGLCVWWCMYTSSVLCGISVPHYCLSLVITYFVRSAVYPSFDYSTLISSYHTQLWLLYYQRIAGIDHVRSDQVGDSG
jgi:hypothetical protein